MTTVLIPVNRLDRAKGRLAEMLLPAQRRSLALATLGTVLDAVHGAGLGSFVLTSDADVRENFPNVQFLAEDPGLQGLNAQLEAVIAFIRSGTNDLLVLHADLPLADSASLRELVAADKEPPSAKLVRSPDGGTNAMLLRPPGMFPLAYGVGSFAAHMERARAAGVKAVAVDIPALALDLDTPADIEALLASDEGRQSRAGRLLLEWREGSAAAGPLP